MKKYTIEFIGTFFLILVVAFTGNPLAIGLVLAALVYMGGYISGAHYNPAVTLAVFLQKKIDSKTAIYYMLTQFFAGIMASAVYYFVHGSTFMPAPGATVNPFSALVIEILFTFLLASVILHVAVSEKTKGNDYFGLAIGLALLAGAYVGGPISGGVFNPAVGIGPMLFAITTIPSHVQNGIIYLAGPFIGGALAGIIYKLR